MKFLTPLLLCPLLIFCQEKSFVHSTTLGPKFFLIDMTRNFPFATISPMNSGLGVEFVKGLSSHFDWCLETGIAFTDSATKVRQPSKDGLIHANFSVRARMFGHGYPIQPYLTAGIGFLNFNQYLNLHMPLGMGLEFRLFNDVFIVTEARYRVASFGAINSHYYYSIGVAGVINKKSKLAKKAVVSPSFTIIPDVPRDLDGDGIVDSADDCPTIAGMAIFSGCPDRDGDGIQDRYDSCIETPGFARYNGCPVPDTDKDGINDEQDSCVFVPGLPMYNGCPAPDFDRDSVSDQEDRCPSIAGDRQNQGCPIVKDEIVKRIKTASARILFFTGSAKLTPSSFKPLNEILEILRTDTLLTAIVHGHTDNIGSTVSNQVLSERRAEAVVDFLIDRGINAGRLKFAGYGESAPISENETAAGRKANRRVEVQLEYKTNW